MTINIDDHDAAYKRLGDALESIDEARLILLHTDTPISVKVRNSVLDAMTKVQSARFVIHDAVAKQTMEESKP